MAVILGRKPGGAAGGGSLPNPSGEPDGDVLTVSGGAAVWSPGAYAAGTDRLVCRISSASFPPGETTIDWTGSVEFQAGTAVTVIGAQIVFVEGGCYSVEIHFPTGPIDDGGTQLTVESKLKLALSGDEWSDGADTAIPSGLTESALDAKYIYPQNAGDHVNAKLVIVGAEDGFVGSIFAQIVKLSNVAAGDEFA